MSTNMDTLISLAKRRGFIFPGSELYGGLSNSWDYGPLGVELKNNIKKEWWKIFVHGRANIVGLDAALIMNPKVWEASGHLEEFTDPLVECKKCHERFRADEIDLKAKCKKCGTDKTFTSPATFNLMFRTFLGPSEDTSSTVYFRPETAQSMFVDFKQILQTSRQRIPFGIAQIGKAFRNEITPGNYIFRTREFEQMEIEYFIAPPQKKSDWEKPFNAWLKEMKSWLKHLGVNPKHLHYVEIPATERAHYSERTVDIEYDFPFGQKELYGLAYRTDFDLKRHMKASGEDLSYTNPDNPQDKFVPHVIEPTWGVDRSVLVAMLEAYTEEKAPTAEKGKTATRVVMKFPHWLSPVKVAILPLLRKSELTKVAKTIHTSLAKHFVTEYDETQSIGRRYRRQDEIGTPYCLTIDFNSLKDKKVTVRNRDNLKQNRVAINNLQKYLKEKLTL